MLVLTRRNGEAVHIGEDIVVRVLGINGGQVRLGFDVPEKINVAREELLKEKPKPAKEA